MSDALIDSLVKARKNQQAYTSPTVQNREAVKVAAGARSGGDDGGFSLTGALWTALETIDKPRAGIVSTIKEGTDLLQGEGFSFSDWSEQFGRNIGFNEVLDDIGVENVWARRIGGFVGDVALDPLTYLTGGINNGVRSVTVADDAFRIAGSIGDDAVAASLNKIGTQIVQRGPTSLTASQVATLNAAKFASGAVSKAGKAGDTATFMQLARKGAVSGLNKSEIRTIQQLAPQSLKTGARITVPGTGRLSRGVVRKTTGKTIGQQTVQVLPQSAVKWTPRGLFQQARGSAKGVVGASQLRKLMGGDYTVLKDSLTSSDPERVATAFNTLRATESGTNAAQAFANDASKATFKVRQLVDDDNHNLIMPALLGDAKARSALGDQAQFVDDFADEWRTAANKHAGNPELVRDLETWAPTKFSKDAEDYFAALDDASAQRFTSKGIDPKNPQAKIAAGREFMGTTIVPQADHPMGLNVRQQADDIFAGYLEDSGVDAPFRLFSDDFVESADASINWQMENVRRERAIQELAKRGVATEMSSNLADLQAKAHAKSRRGHLILDNIKEQMHRTKRKVAVTAKKLERTDESRSAVLKVIDDPEAGALQAARSELDKASKSQDEILGQARRTRRKLERAQREAGEARREAVRDISKAERLGARLSELDTQIATTNAKLRTFEDELSQVINIPATEAELVELGERVAAAKARMQPTIDLVEKAQRIGVRESDFTALGYKDAKEAAAKYRAHLDALDVAEQHRAALADRLGVALGGRNGVETTEWYQAQIRQARDQLKRRVNGRQVVVDLLDAESEHVRVIAGASQPPAPLANGRLGNRVGDEWGTAAKTAMRGNENMVTPTRFYGDVLSEGAPDAEAVFRDGVDAVRDAATGRPIPSLAQRYNVLSGNPIHYAEGEPAMWMDGLDALFTGGFKPMRTWGPQWGKIARDVRAGETLEQSIRRHMPKADPWDAVHDLVNSTAMSPDAKRALAKAHRNAALQTGHDAITYLDDDGVWNAIPLDRNMVEGLTTDLPDETVQAAIKLRQDQVDSLYEGVQLKEELAEQLGYDLEALNGRIIDPDELNRRSAQVNKRIAELTDDFVDNSFRYGTPELETEATLLKRVQDIDQELVGVTAPEQRSVMTLEREAAAAQAQLTKLGKQAQTMEQWLKKASKLSDDDIVTTLNVGHKQVGAAGILQIPDWVEEGLRSHSALVGDTKGMLGTFDKITRLWKAQAVASPGFHTRNALGGMINNYSAGIDIGAYSDFLKANKVYSKAIKNNASVEDALATVRTELGELGERYAAVRQSGVLAGGQFDELSYIAAGTGASSNPFNERFGLYRMGRKGGVQVEEFLRGALAMDTIAKGGDIDNAISMVHKFHFDYEDLSSWERNVGRRVIPFYTWSRKNLPLQLEMLTESPQTFQRYLAVQRNLEVGTEEEALFPSYLERLNSIRTPWAPGGNRLYVTPTLPFSDMTQMTEWRSIASSANPLVRLPLELGSDQSFFTGAPFGERYDKMPVTWAPLIPALSQLGVVSKDARGEWQIKASASHVVSGMSPLMGTMWRLDPSGPRPDDRIATSAASWLFGLGTRVNTPYDQSIEAYRRARDYDKPIQRARELGYDNQVEELRQEQFEWYDIANKLKEDGA